MKPAGKPKPVDSREPASQADGASTLAYVEPRSQLDDQEERGSGVRKIDGTEPTLLGSVLDIGASHHVGPYRLIERIGEGAMGHVYRAEHTLLGRVVAIKMLRAELTCDDACVRRFLAEARAVNLIKHPHVIDVTDFACTPAGQPWFVMEMLEGSDLSVAASNERLSLPRKLEIARQLCEALESVHAAGVVHRDVKPENVFLRQRDGADFVTLLDFGIARLPDPTNADPRQDGLMGTSYYMAPEQAAASAIDHRADLYAVGSTLFELVAGIGRTPFRAELLQQQLMDVMMTPAPRLSDRATVPAIVRQDLDRLVERLLAKEPDQRPSSAREVADELVRISKKLEAPAARSSDAIPTPMLLERDAVASRPTPVAARRRARRAARARGSDIAPWAVALAAIAAAGAVWLATRESSWSDALPRPLIPDRGTEHVVEPLTTTADTPSPTPAPAQGSQALVPALPDDKVTKPDDDDTRKGNARRARRAPRAKAPPEREASVISPQPAPAPAIEPPPEPVVEPQPQLTIEPAPQPDPPVREEEDDENSIDRDVVLNPFDP